MNKTQIINFNGGFVEISVSQLPIFEKVKWKIRLYAKIVAADETTKTEGRKILINKGFTTNGNQTDEFYKIIYLDFV